MTALTFHAHNPYCDCEDGREIIPATFLDGSTGTASLYCEDCGPTAMLTVSTEGDLAWLTELAANTHYSPEKDNWYSFIGHPGKAWIEVTTRLLRFTGEFDLAAALRAADPECVDCGGSGRVHGAITFQGKSGTGSLPCPCRKYDLTGVDAVVLESQACTCSFTPAEWQGHDLECLNYNLAAAREALTERGVEVIG